MTAHDWASHALPGRSYETCRVCGAKGITWNGVFRQTKGAQECPGKEKAA